MSSIRKKAALGGAAVVISIGGWLGAGIYAGIKVESTLRALQMAPSSPSTSLRLVQVEHDRGLWNSHGKADLMLIPGCESQEGQDEPISVRVDYTVAHLPLPSGLVRFDWKLMPGEEAAAKMRKTFGVTAPLTGTGTVAMSGQVYTDMAVPELSMKRSGSAIQIAPSHGFLSMKDKALAFGWKLERAVARSDGDAVEVKDLAIDLDLHNRYLGTGDFSVKLGSVSAGFGTVEGIALTTKATEQDERLDMVIRPSVRSLQVGPKRAQDLALELGVKGVHARSLETLSTMFSTSCGMKSLTAGERSQVREALNTLLVKGFSMGITQLAGKSDEGDVSGQMMVELTEAKSGRFSLPAQLRSNGRLSLSGQFLLTPEQRELAINLGFAMSEGKNGGLQSSYDYREGLMKFNGRTLDAGNFMAKLEALDHEIAMALSDAPASQSAKASIDKTDEEVIETPPQARTEETVQPTSTPPPVTSVEASVVNAPAPAAMQTAAAEADCQALAECIQHSLAAGRRQDIDAVRRYASRIEAMPKPDLGNRAVSRQLNTAALEALKKSDFDNAVQQLQRAQRENGRDVEIAGNLGYALLKGGQHGPAIEAMQSALLLDPRRTSTWTPLAEALALAGREADAKAALWISFQWSPNRDKSLAYYQDRATNDPQPRLQALYAHMAEVAARQP